MFLEDIISGTQKERIIAVEEAENWSFNNLVLLSGLDPTTDFRFLDLSEIDMRNEDLRGFDFTGSDLRGCLRNKETIIDSTTTLTGSLQDWVDVEELQIVEVMSEVETARGHRDRVVKLEKLISNYRSPDHIRIYLRNLISTTRSVDAFFDYLDFFDPKHSEDIRAVAKGLVRFSQSSVKHPGRTRKYLSPSTTSFKLLLDRIADSANPVAQDAFNIYLRKLSDSGREDRSPRHPLVEEDFSQLIDSIEEAGGQSTLALD